MAKMGRPSKVAEERLVHVGFRMLKSELVKAEEAAKAEEMSLSAWVREAILERLERERGFAP